MTKEPNVEWSEELDREWFKAVEVVRGKVLEMLDDMSITGQLSEDEVVAIAHDQIIAMMAELYGGEFAARVCRNAAAGLQPPRLLTDDEVLKAALAAAKPAGRA